jgi:hypothetical protein
MSSSFTPNWSPTAYYVLGDNVFYIDRRYRLIVAGSTPGLLGVPPPDNPAGWEVFTTGVTSLGDGVEPPIDGDVLLIPGDGISVMTQFPENGIRITNTSASANFLYNYYVSDVGGNDTTGNGSIAKPWKTIGKALTVAGVIADSNQVSIILAAGVYVEDVNITRANTFISGSATSLSTSTLIAGSVTIDLTASVLPFIIGGLSSVQVSNIVYNNSVANNQSYLVTDCFIVPFAGRSAIALTDTSPGGSGDLTIQSCLIYMADAVAITNSNGFLTLVNTEIRNNPTIPSTLSMITTSGTGRVNTFGSIITQSSTLSTVQPIVNLTNDATTSSMTFYNSTLQYTSATSDAGTGAKCCIRCSNSATISQIVLFNCLLLCQGATTTNGTAGQFLCFQRTGAGNVLLNHGQNSGSPNAHFLPSTGGGFTKIQFLNVT